MLTEELGRIEGRFDFELSLFMGVGRKGTDKCAPFLRASESRQSPSYEGSRTRGRERLRVAHKPPSG